MSNKIEIDADGDNDPPIPNQPCCVYFKVNDNLIVLIKYKADFEEKSEPGEYWGEYLAITPSVWVEVNKVNILSVEAVYNIESDQLPQSAYTLAPNDEMKMQQRIEDMICAIEPKIEVGYNYYCE